MKTTVLRAALGLPAVLLALSARAVNAQGTIITDRPGLGFVTSTVSAGTVQIEAGIPAAVASDAGTDTRLINIPTLVRLGVTGSLELRVGSTLFNSSTVD